MWPITRDTCLFNFLNISAKFHSFKSPKENLWELLGLTLRQRMTKGWSLPWQRSSGVPATKMPVVPCGALWNRVIWWQQQVRAVPGRVALAPSSLSTHRTSALKSQQYVTGRYSHRGSKSKRNESESNHKNEKFKFGLFRSLAYHLVILKYFYSECDHVFQ